MSINNVTIQGRIPFDLEMGGNEQHKVLTFKVSAKRSYKKDDEQYFPEDAITCKAFGKTAEFIEKYFGKGKGINVIGSLRIDDPYEKDGNTIYPPMYVLVEKVAFIHGDVGEKQPSESKPKSGLSTVEKKRTNPFPGKKKSMLG